MRCFTRFCGFLQNISFNYIKSGAYFSRSTFLKICYNTKYIRFGLITKLPNRQHGTLCNVASGVQYISGSDVFIEAHPARLFWYPNPHFFSLKQTTKPWLCGLFGGDKRDRTADLLNAIQALSQLSYTPMVLKPLNLLGFCVIRLLCFAGSFTG